MNMANRQHTGAVTLEAIATALKPNRLIVCGAFNVCDQAQLPRTPPTIPPEPRASLKRLPIFPDGTVARSLVLVGNAGSALWPVLSASEEHQDGQPDALDRWSLRVGLQYAEQFGGHAVYPFAGPPHHPFLEWAQRCQGLRASRLGLSIHPEYGLWHAYRFALLFRVPLSTVPPHLPHSDICAQCVSQPCLRACPVGAFSEAGYDVDTCVGFLNANPEASCHRAGCAARIACPQGAEYRYEPAHASFHMAAFVRARTPLAGAAEQ